MFLVDWFYGVLASLGLWQKEAKILFLGRDDAGRTKLLHMLKDAILVQHQPTQSWTYVVPGNGKIKFKAFDLGGHQIALRVLKDYNAKVDAVLYVMDASYLMVMNDPQLLEVLFAKSREELDALLSDESLANVPFLVVVVITDEILYTASDEVLLHRSLGLSNLTTGRGNVNLANSNVRPLEVFIYDIYCKMDYGDGFKWLSQYIK